MIIVCAKIYSLALELGLEYGEMVFLQLKKLEKILDKRTVLTLHVEIFTKKITVLKVKAV